jgi:hypothetical protein
MKLVLQALICALLMSARAFADAAPDQTMKLINGGTATAFYHCGDMDLCGRVTYPDGSSLSIYSEGAALCQPYALHFVLQNAAGVTQFEFSRMINHTDLRDKGCGHTLPTQMVLDRGSVHMTVIENLDGTLNLVFSATS